MALIWLMQANVVRRIGAGFVAPLGSASEHGAGCLNLVARSGGDSGPRDRSVGVAAARAKPFG